MLEAYNQPYDSQPEAYTPTSDKATFDEISKILKTELNDAESQMDAHRERVKVWRSFFELKVPNREPLFEGGANYRTPVVRNKVSKIGNLLVGALDVDPFFVLRARTSKASEVALNLQEYLDLRVDDLQFRDHVDQVVEEALLTGVGITKVGFEQVGTGLNAKKRNRVELIQLEDFLVSPVTVAKLEDAYMVANRFYVPYWKLEQWKQDGVVTGDIHLLDQAVTMPNEVAHDIQGHSNMSSSNQGSKSIELYECWWQWQGRMCCTWIHRNSGTVLKHDINPYQHARAPFTLTYFHRRPNYLIGFSLAELLEAAQLEIDATRNARMDAVSLSVGGIYSIEVGSMEEKFLRTHRMDPGIRIETENIERPKIRPMDLPPLNPATFQEISLLYQDIDRATIPETSLSSNPVRDRVTAEEIKRDTDMTTSTIKKWLHTIHAGLRETGLMILHNLQQFEVRVSINIGKDPNTGMPIPEMGVLGFFSKTGLKQVSASEMFLEDFDLEVNGRETATMKAEKTQEAFQDLQIIAPFLLQLQGQPIQDSRLYELYKNFLLARDRKDWEDLLGPPPLNLALMVQQQALSVVKGECSYYRFNKSK